MRVEAMDNQPSSFTAESKYSYLLEDEPIIRSFLDAMFLKDQTHPEDRINSIYFDTRTRRHLAEKVDSDYVKMKVRLRWYGKTLDLDPEQVVNAYLEVKIKNGSRRKKSRQPIEVRAGLLNNGAKSFDELMQFVLFARECGWVPCGQLFPALVIHYDRRRYRDPHDWASLALDSCITYSSVNPLLWPTTASRQLSVGVLEVKSETGALPRSLWSIRERFGMRDAFSKYEECWQMYTDPFYGRNFRSVNFD
jgi:hypothetical protein